MMLRGLGWRPLRRGPWSFVTTRTLLRLWRRLGAWHFPMIVGRWRRPIRKMLHSRRPVWKNCGRSMKHTRRSRRWCGGRCAGACCCTQALGLGGGCGIHCPGGLSSGGDAVWPPCHRLRCCWPSTHQLVGRAAAVSAPMARC